MDYTSIIGAKSAAGSLMRWVNNSSIDVETILAESKEWVEHRLRVKDMLKRTTSLTLTPDTAGVITPPDDCITPLVWTITGPNVWMPLKKTTAQLLEPEMMFTGTASRVPALPGKYYEGAAGLELDSVPDGTYTSRMLYYARGPALGTATTTNYLTARYSRLFRLVLMAQANEFLKDAKERDYWQTLALGEIADMNAEFERNLENGELPDAMPPYGVM